MREAASAVAAEREAELQEKKMSKRAKKEKGEETESAAEPGTESPMSRVTRTEAGSPTSPRGES